MTYTSDVDKRIFVMLRDTNCTLAEIASQIGVSKGHVWNLKERLLPERRSGRGSRLIIQRHETIGKFLRETDLPLSQIAKKVGVTREAVRNVQKKYFPEFSRHKQRKEKPQCLRPALFRRELLRILRASGAMWCTKCKRVKCLDDFSPYVRRGRNGKPCRVCNADRTFAYYQSHFKSTSQPARRGSGESR